MKAAHIGIVCVVCSLSTLIFISVNWINSSTTSSLLAVGPLGPNFGFVLGLSGANAVLAQLRYAHLTHVRTRHHAKSQSLPLLDRKAYRRENVGVRSRQGRLQQLSSGSESESDLDADDPRFSNRIWKHQEPENNTFADLQVRIPS